MKVKDIESWLRGLKKGAASVFSLLATPWMDISQYANFPTEWYCLGTYYMYRSDFVLAGFECSWRIVGFLELNKTTNNQHVLRPLLWMNVPRYETFRQKILLRHLLHFTIVRIDWLYSAFQLVVGFIEFSKTNQQSTCAIPPIQSSSLWSHFTFKKLFLHDSRDIL